MSKLNNSPLSGRDYPILYKLYLDTFFKEGDVMVSMSSDGGMIISHTETLIVKTLDELYNITMKSALEYENVDDGMKIDIKNDIDNIFKSSTKKCSDIDTLMLDISSGNEYFNIRKFINGEFKDVLLRELFN
jgi:hypothetical protein